MPTSYKAVFFDFGGTLFSYRRMDRPQVELLLRAAERLGVEADAPAAIRAYRDASRASWKIYMQRSFYLHLELFRETFRGFAEGLSAEPSDDFLDWVHEEQRAMAVEHLEVRPGCAETLAELADEGLHVGIVSNIDEDYLAPMLAQAGLEALVHSRTSSEEARSCKPDARIFHHALEKSGTEPGETLFVGDSPEADVLGAGRVGMPTVLIREEGSEPPGSGAAPSAEPDHVIEELRELLRIVRRP
jgi:putative hydrolase of the HAD superfamily